MTSAPTPPTAPPSVPAAPARRPRRTGLLVGVIAGVLVVLLALGFLGFLLVRSLLGTGQSASDSAKAMPAATVSWVEVSIDPSNEQKLQALGFVDQLDELRDLIEDSDLELDFDDPQATDLKEAFWNLLTDGRDAPWDTSLDYDDDVRPWLGNRVAVGVLEGDDDDAEPQVVVALQTTGDVEAGVDAAETLVDDLDMDAEVGDHEGYVVIASDGVDLDELYEDGTLAESPDFRASMEDAGEWGVLSYWVDLGRVAQIAASATDVPEDYTDVQYWRGAIRANPSGYAPYPDTEYLVVDPECDETVEYSCEEHAYRYDGEYYLDFDDYAQAYVADNLDELAEEKAAGYQAQVDARDELVERFAGSSTHGVLRFADGALELAGGGTGFADLPEHAGDGAAVGALPDTTMAVMALSGVAEAIDAALTDENLAAASGFGSLLGTEPYTREDVVDWIDDNVGLSIPEDLDTLFGRQFTIAVDEDLETDLDSVDSADEIVESGIALVVVSDDPEETADQWRDLLDRLEEEVGESVGVDVEVDGDRVVVSAGDNLDRVLEPEGTLADSEVFRDAMPAAEGADHLLYLDVARLLDTLDGLGDGLEVLDGVQALALSDTITGDDSFQFVLRVTTER